MGRCDQYVRREKDVSLIVCLHGAKGRRLRSALPSLLGKSRSGQCSRCGLASLDKRGCRGAFRVPPLNMAFCERRLFMAKLMLLVALAFSVATGSITMLVLNPQHAIACPGNDGR